MLTNDTKLFNVCSTCDKVFASVYSCARLLQQHHVPDQESVVISQKKIKCDCSDSFLRFFCSLAEYREILSAVHAVNDILLHSQLSLHSHNGVYNEVVLNLLHVFCGFVYNTVMQGLLSPWPFDAYPLKSPHGCRFT
jgi:hypothetical protein